MISLEKVYVEITGQELEKIVGEVYGQEYDLWDDINFCPGADAPKLKTCFKINISYPTKSDLDKVRSFMNGDDVEFITNSLLNDLCIRKEIEPGDYLITF